MDKYIDTTWCLNCDSETEYIYIRSQRTDILWSIRVNCTSDCLGWHIGFWYSSVDGEWHRVPAPIPSGVPYNLPVQVDRFDENGFLIEVKNG